MKIKRIELYNVGPYLGKNCFDLDLSKEKNIVLIGGKNGAGKTTFFKSIKTCLYGCKVWGYDAPGKEYLAIISSLINTKSQYNNQAKAYVLIDLLFDDGKENNTYTLKREWVRNNKNTTEMFTILKNGDALEEDKTADFINYLLSIIPPDMFNFYFFDGEAIAEFFLGSEGGKNFKNAFLKLYGLDTLNIMVENFQRSLKKREGKTSSSVDYQKAKSNLEEKEAKYDSLHHCVQQKENELDLLQVKLQSLQKDYSKEGGVSLTEWKNINQEMASEEIKRDEINRWLKDIANSQLPFVIVRNEVEKLTNQLEKEKESLRATIIEDFFRDKGFKERLDTFLHNKNLNAEELISFIKENELGDSIKDSIFDFSLTQIAKIENQATEKISFNSKEIIKAVRDLEASLQKSKKLRETLLKSSIDGYEEYAEEREKLEKEISACEISIEKMKAEEESLKLEILNNDIIFRKVKEGYESLLKNKSIANISERAVAAYTLLEEKLIKRQSRILQDEFVKCFTAIINKGDFLDGIVVDKNITITPYKYTDVNYSQINNYLLTNEKTGFLDSFDTSYWMEINRLRLGEKDTIKLPSPVTAPFSQGERQVFIMALYLALLRTSRKDIPFFIDTPFARIDSNHREKIVNEFFKGIDNQIFILSTDEEIVGTYKTQIEDEISNKFVLEINGYGTTSVTKNKYFGE